MPQKTIPKLGQWVVQTVLFFHGTITRRLQPQGIGHRHEHPIRDANASDSQLIAPAHTPEGIGTNQHIATQTRATRATGTLLAVTYTHQAIAKHR